VPGVRLESLLDATPLRATVDAWMDWPAVHANIGDGPVDALAVVATSAATERAVVFVEGRRQEELPPASLVDYVGGALGAQHVLASAAIPWRSGRCMSADRVGRRAGTSTAVRA
jgi:NTE family protein